MKDGIYYVKFKSNIQDFGDGTVIVQNKIINGGDYGFSYKGKIVGDEVKLDIQQHDQSVSSVMGEASKHDLYLKVQETANGYNLVGGSNFAPGVKIIVEAKFIGDLLV
ncbi:GrlR family regulatory protein [Acinetobacter radioresistens]|uniref:GrlR family regulatory protein n=1 Tax=Acinetobacter radioresistens TaxID=40216 RepID=UPI003A802AEE